MAFPATNNQNADTTFLHSYYLLLRWQNNEYVCSVDDAQHAYVACRSETCATLKHFSDWHGVRFWKMWISEVCFDWHHANFVISEADNNMSF